MRHKYIFSAALLAGVSGACFAAVDADPVAEINTFIGTQDEGNTFPGASAPFGMIQVSPIGTHYAGWQYTDKKIRGFGHFFLSGAGCYEQGGLVSILPVTARSAPVRNSRLTRRTPKPSIKRTMPRHTITPARSDRPDTTKYV